VIFRSTVACVFGSVLFWLLSWGINYGAATARGTLESRHLATCTIPLAETAYWVFPKPIDAELFLFNALGRQHDFEKPMAFPLIESSAEFSPTRSIVSVVVLTGVLLALATREFHATDY
jgi:hypothetical protein